MKLESMTERGRRSRAQLMNTFLVVWLCLAPVLQGRFYVDAFIVNAATAESTFFCGAWWPTLWGENALEVCHLTLRKV